MIVRDEGAWGDVTKARAYVDGAWRELNEAQAYQSGAWRIAAEFVDDLSLTISPPSAVGNVLGSGFAVTLPVTALPAGGRGPFTYQWTFVSGTQGALSSPLPASTTFSLFLTSGSNASAVYNCAVTDSLGSLASANVSVVFQSDDLN